MFYRKVLCKLSHFLHKRFLVHLECLFNNWIHDSHHQWQQQRQQQQKYNAEWERVVGRIFVTKYVNTYREALVIYILLLVSNEIPWIKESINQIYIRWHICHWHYLKNSNLQRDKSYLMCAAFLEWGLLNHYFPFRYFSHSSSLSKHTL